MDRRQNNGNVNGGVPSPLPSDLCTAQFLFQLPCLGSHKDNITVRCTAAEEQLEAKEVQLSQPSSTSLLVISSGLKLKVQLHLSPLDLLIF